jgi:alpha-L-fucosidase 2
MKCGILFFTLFALLLTANTKGGNMPGRSDDALAYLQRCNVIWDTPSADSSGSMPLGNGDIGVNVWVEPNGDLVFYLSKTDAWSEVNRLLKLGTVRVSLSPSLLNGGRFFRQELRLLQGEVLVQGGTPDKPTTLRVWVDAYRPVVWVDVDSPQPVHVRAQLEIWRNSDRRLEGRELFSAYGLMDAPFPVVEHADTVIEEHRDRVVWFHRNPSSIFEQNLRHQGLESLIGKIPDPLLHRTFGGMMRGKGLVGEDARTLRSAMPAKRFSIAIHLLTAQTDTAEQWVKQLEAQAAKTEAVPRNQARAAHQRWWLSFWRRSWIVVSGTPQSDVVTQGYTLQRFINACAGRGAYPIKFNGSIFTVDSREPDEHFDADYRRWGGEYWFQNTRLPYWSMIPAGDFEMMQPLFKMYANALPLAKERTRLYFGHEGAYCPETITSWGTYASCNYGWNREGKPISHIDNPYIRYYYSCNLELLTLALEYFFHTGDKRFLHETLLPLADAFIAFYERHFPRNDDGKLLLKPAQSLETYPEVVNPLPDIAGLRWTLDGLLRLPLGKESARRRNLWQRLLGQLPPLPTKTENGHTFLLPAEQILAQPINSENPELYGVFPYRLYGVGKPDIQIARNTYARRPYKGNEGWRQDPIWAAMLGMAEEARNMVAQRFATKHPGSRFPAFWGPNYDWIPDQDHGCAGMIALQAMLMQTDGNRILLFPAWPKEWDVSFRLHAPGKTVVEGVLRAGKLQTLKVTPTTREKDVIVLEPQ